jgi:arabinofuranosyltransferase
MIAESVRSTVFAAVLRHPLAFTVALGIVVAANAAIILTGPGDPFMDDAWISLRYARNLVEGDGLVMNLGERVEGYTHPLWVLLDAIVLALHLPPRATLSFVGVGCWWGAALATRRAARDAGASSAAQWFAGATVACAATGVFWGLSGLETAAFAWALVVAIRLGEAARRGESRGVVAGIAFGVACWLRPEGALAMAIASSTTLATRAADGSRRRALTTAATMIGAAALTYAPWQLFRVLYYDALFPNTFFAKSAGHPTWMLERGARYVLESAKNGPLVPLVVIILLAPRVLTPGRALVPFAVAVALAAWTLWVGGDYLPFGRFIVPILPLLALGAASAYDELRERFQRRLVHTALCAVVLSGVIGHFGESRVRAFENATARYGAAGAWLRDYAEPSMLIATPAAGIIGWMSKVRVLDEFGLTDATIARTLDPRLDPKKLRAPAGHERGNAIYLLERAPDAILLANVWVRPIPLTPPAFRANLGITSITDRLLVEDQHFYERYDVLDYRLQDQQWFGLAVRKDSALHPSHPAYRGPAPATAATAAP